MAGFARIPIPEQQVAVPRVPAPALRSEAAPPSALAGAAESLNKVSEGFEGYARIAEVQAAHAATLNKADAEEQFKASHAVNVEDVKANHPPEKWAENLAILDQATAKNLQEDPKYQNIAPDLSARFSALMPIMRAQMQNASVVQVQKDQHALVQKLNGSRAADAANDFTADFKDGPKAQAATAQQYRLIDSLQLAPELKDQYKRDFQDKKMAGRAALVAQGSAAQPFLLDKFIKSQPGGTFTPMQIKGFQELQRTAIEEPYHLTTAEHEAQVAQHIAAIQNAPPAQRAGMASQAIGEGWITAEYGRQWGGKWRDPGNGSAPGLVKQYTDEIKQDPFKYSAADISAIPKDDLSPDDRRALQAARYDGVKAAKQPLNSEYVNSRRLIKDAGAPSGLVNFNAEAKKQKVADAVSDLDVMMKSGQLQSAKDVIDAREQIIKSYFPKPKKAVPHVTTFKPSAIPPAVAAKIAAHARGLGFDPSVGGGD